MMCPSCYRGTVLIGGSRFCPHEQKFVDRKVEDAVDLDGCAFVIGVGAILLSAFILINFLGV